MEKVLKSGFLICLLLSLTGCPYKEIYKPSISEGVTSQGIKITPVTLYYDSWHKKSTCTVGLSVENQTDSLQRLIFQDGYLTNSKKTLAMEKIYCFADSLPPTYAFEIEPKENMSVGLAFQDSTKYFGDTITVGFILPDNRKFKFVYTKDNR